MTVAPTTDEYWDADGVVLNRHGWNISTLGGRAGLPAPKGSDIDIPYATGESWRSKTPAGRTLTLAMWVRGVALDPDDTPYIDDVVAYNENLDALIKTLYHIDRQIVLTKRWRMANGLRTASALCSYSGGLDPSMSGRTLSRLGVDLRLANPWFYTPQITTPHIVRGGASQTFVNDGHVHLDGYGVFVDFYGPLGINTELTATQAGQPTVKLKLTTALAGGESVTFDIQNFLATKSTGENMIQYVTRTGRRSWMVAWKGTTTYSLAGTGTGYATVSAKAAYA